MLRLVMKVQDHWAKHWSTTQHSQGLTWEVCSINNKAKQNQNTAPTAISNSKREQRCGGKLTERCFVGQHITCFVENMEVKQWKRPKTHPYITMHTSIKELIHPKRVFPPSGERFDKMEVMMRLCQHTRASCGIGSRSAKFFWKTQISCKCGHRCSRKDHLGAMREHDAVDNALAVAPATRQKKHSVCADLHDVYQNRVPLPRPKFSPLYRRFLCNFSFW